MKNWEIWATQTHCKSKKWKISWTKGQLSLRWLMLIFPPPWKKGPPKALPLINPNDLWQTIPKNVFFSAFIKTSVQVISNENSFIYHYQTQNFDRLAANFTSWVRSTSQASTVLYTENILAASMALPQWHRCIACLINIMIVLLSTCFWQLRQSVVTFWFNRWNK